MNAISDNCTDLKLPVDYSPDFEGERVRDDNVHLECGRHAHMVEWVTSKSADEIIDGHIEVIGPEITDIEQGAELPMAIVVEAAGLRMRVDYEAILERRIHRMINFAKGVTHTGQRDCCQLRVSKQAVTQGFRLYHIGKIIHSEMLKEFEPVVDKLQVKIFTGKNVVPEIARKARVAYVKRDERTEGMRDETTDTYYSCTICQSLAPSHVCIISPEKSGMCGAYDWLDCKTAFEINPFGPSQPVLKGEILNARLGRWRGVDDVVLKASHGKTASYSSYSIIANPATACGCAECYAVVMPLCNGIMIVNREFPGVTPCGMEFVTLENTAGNGISAPGFIGHSVHNITQRKFVSAEGGIKRLVWMPRLLKERISRKFNAVSAEMGFPKLLGMIADETIGVTEEDILPYLTQKKHPALFMEPII